MSGKSKVFVRDATGLVRNISVIDAFLGSWGFVALPLALTTYTTGPYLFPGADLVFATVVTTLLCIPIALMFTLFAWALPRSGGDYVLISRTLNPVLGFMSSVSLMFWFLFFIGFQVNWVMTLAVSPSLLIIGTVTSNQALINAASVASQPQYVVAVGLLIVVVFTAVLLRGTRATFLLSNLILIVTLAGVALAIGLLATSSSTTFMSAFSRFASYDSIITAAHQQGYSPQGPFLAASLGLMPFIYLTPGFAFVTTYYSGEIKTAKKNLFYSQVLVAITSGLILAVIAGLAVRDFGYDFLGSISFLQGTGASQYPFGSLPPYLNLFLSLLTTNPVIIWILGITYVAALLEAYLPSLMAVSRSAFAWAFDQVIPTKFAEVHERFHVPVYTILAMSAIWALAMITYTYWSSYFLALISGAAFGENISLIVVSIAAIVFPFRRKEFYEPSPANIQVGPVPLLSIAGAISLVFVLVLQYYLATNPFYGANSPPVMLLVAVIFLIGAPLYAISYYYHKRKGLNISLVFKEIPPE